MKHKPFGPVRVAQVTAADGFFIRLTSTSRTGLFFLPTLMYGKIFEQIYDSSIAEDWHVRVVFQDMVILADMNGVVDRTPEAISRRTNVPLDIVERAIAELEKPDHRSRTPDHEGARIKRLDEHRTWGWYIVNHHRFKGIATDEQRREKTLQRVHKYRGNKAKRAVTQCNASVTQCNAGNATQIHTQTHTDTQTQTETKEAPIALVRFKAPNIEACRLLAVKAGLPETEGDKFYHFYDSKGWKVGRQPMKSLNGAMGGWACRCREKNSNPDRHKLTDAELLRQSL